MCSYLQKHATAYDIFSSEENVNDIDTSKATTSTVSTMCPSTVTGEDSTQYISSSMETTKLVLMDKEGITIQVCSPVTGEESTRYISSSLETTKPVLVDKEGTTIPVRKVSLMSPRNPDAHIDPAFTDLVLLIKNTITLKDYSKVKKKEHMNLVPFKKDQRFWTIDEAEEDADNEDNHDDFSVCADAACSDAYSDVMPSFLDVTKCSLSMPMPLSDGTKPRTDKLKSDTHTNKLEQNTSHTPSQVSVTAWATVLTPLVIHSNSFGCLSDEDNDKAPTVESALVSTTNDEFSDMNGDAFYISTNLDQQQQLLGLSSSCCTSLYPSLGASLCTLLGTSLGRCILLALFGPRGDTYPNHCASSNAHYQK